MDRNSPTIRYSDGQYRRHDATMDVGRIYFYGNNQTSVQFNALSCKIPNGGKPTTAGLSSNPTWSLKPEIINLQTNRYKFNLISTQLFFNCWLVERFIYSLTLLNLLVTQDICKNNVCDLGNAHCRMSRHVSLAGEIPHVQIYKFSSLEAWGDFQLID